MIPEKAYHIRSKIGADVRNKMISLYMDRNFLGINLQYIEKGKITIRSLAVLEVMARQTGEFLKEKLLQVLTDFSIEIKQIYSITTDNGSNFKKMTNLMIDECCETRNGADMEEESSSEDEASQDENQGHIDYDHSPGVIVLLMRILVLRQRSLGIKTLCSAALHRCVFWAVALALPTTTLPVVVEASPTTSSNFQFENNSFSLLHNYEVPVTTVTDEVVEIMQTQEISLEQENLEGRPTTIKQLPKRSCRQRSARRYAAEDRDHAALEAAQSRLDAIEARNADATLIQAQAINNLAAAIDRLSSTTEKIVDYWLLSAKKVYQQEPAAVPDLQEDLD